MGDAVRVGDELAAGCLRGIRLGLRFLLRGGGRGRVLLRGLLSSDILRPALCSRETGANALAEDLSAAVADLGEPAGGVPEDANEALRLCRLTVR